MDYFRNLMRMTKGNIMDKSPIKTNDVSQPLSTGIEETKVIDSIKENPDPAGKEKEVNSPPDSSKKINKQNTVVKEIFLNIDKIPDNTASLEKDTEKKMGKEDKEGKTIDKSIDSGLFLENERGEQNRQNRTGEGDVEIPSYGEHTQEVTQKNREEQKKHKEIPLEKKENQQDNALFFIEESDLKNNVNPLGINIGNEAASEQQDQVLEKEQDQAVEKEEKIKPLIISKVQKWIAGSSTTEEIPSLEQPGGHGKKQVIQPVTEKNETVQISIGTIHLTVEDSDRLQDSNTHHSFSSKKGSDESSISKTRIERHYINIR